MVLATAIPGCEAMVYSTDGVPLQGTTGGYGDDGRVEYIIPRNVGFKATKASMECSVRRYNYVGRLFVLLRSGVNARDIDDGTSDYPGGTEHGSLAVWDFMTLRELANALPGNTPLQNKVLTAANEIMNVFKRVVTI
ncbi:hypothetical protein APHAL10511_003100 [Amanita phalloides]|nr:hypothetical protein APHAL10511_003100 [Amanita phalloides]